MIFLGKVPHEQLPTYMREADYLALYSSHEGLSHTILEALYAGTPVIASARGGNPEVVRDGINGLLVEYGDVRALTATIQRAFQGSTAQTLASGTQIGLERLSWSTLVEQTAHTLEAVASQFS